MMKSLLPALGFALLLTVWNSTEEVAASEDLESTRSVSNTAVAITPMTKAFEVSGPYSHEGLSVFLIHGENRLLGADYLTLEEALDEGTFVVRETGSVNELQVENLSNQPVFIQAGDIVKGGKQDRVLATDIVIPAESGSVPIASFCVESGRWQSRGTEAVHHFSSSKDYLSSKELKIAAKASGNQSQVWKEVESLQRSLVLACEMPVKSEESPSSLQLTLENEGVQKATDAYIEALSDLPQKRNDVIGYAFAINGELNSADIYASQSLFQKLWPKLLKASAAEAVSVGSETQATAPTIEGVRNWLADAARGGGVVKSVSDETMVITVDSDADYLFETRGKSGAGGWLHRNYIRK